MRLSQAIKMLQFGARGACRPEWSAAQRLRLYGASDPELMLGHRGRDPETGRDVFFHAPFTVSDLEAEDYVLCDQQTWFVSGHMDLTEDEFKEHYASTLERLVRAGDSVVVGDAPGADMRAQLFVDSLRLQLAEELCSNMGTITVYHMLDAPRHNPAGLPTLGGFKSDRERDAAMTAASDHDVAWVRPGREKSGTADNLRRRGRMTAQKGGR